VCVCTQYIHTHLHLIDRWREKERERERGTCIAISMERDAMVGMSVPKDPSVKGLVPRVVLSGDGGILRSGAYWEVFRSVGNALKHCERLWDPSLSTFWL
jgi:hypothetical protein